MPWRTHSCVQRSHFPETLHLDADSEAFRGAGWQTCGRLANRPALWAAGSSLSRDGPVSAARDAPEGTVFRSCERASSSREISGALDSRPGYAHYSAHGRRAGSAAPGRAIAEKLLDPFSGVDFACIDVALAVYAHLM